MYLLKSNVAFDLRIRKQGFGQEKNLWCAGPPPMPRTMNEEAGEDGNETVRVWLVPLLDWIKLLSANSNL